MVNDKEKAATLIRRHVTNWQGNIVRLDEKTYRFISVNEAEALQTVPKDYTKAATKKQSHEMLGNGWTVDVIAHIFSYMKGGVDINEF